MSDRPSVAVPLRAARTTMSTRVASPRVVQVAIAEDHPLYRFALEQAIDASAGLRLVGSFAEGAAMVDSLASRAADVALVDLQLIDMHGIELVEQLATRYPGVRSVVLSAHLNEHLLSSAFAVGAAAYLSKDLGAEEICDAVVAVSRGETVLSPAAQRVLGTSLRAGHLQPRSGLTTREFEILRLSADGRSRDEIARLLHLSASTVKVHLGRAYEKLRATDRASAIAEAFRRGILT